MLAVGDISGKGISAALLMATIHSAVRAYTIEDVPALRELTTREPVAVASGGSGLMLASESRGADTSPATLLTLLNHQLYESTPAAKYATLFLGLYNGATRRLWMKMPNLASRYHSGVGRWSRDFHFGSYRRVSAADNVAPAIAAPSITRAARSQSEWTDAGMLLPLRAAPEHCFSTVIIAGEVRPAGGDDKDAFANPAGNSAMPRVEERFGFNSHLRAQRVLGDGGKTKRIEHPTSNIHQPPSKAGKGPAIRVG